MPIKVEGTVTMDELVAEMLKLDRAVVVQGLQDKAQPIFQEIFNKGHSTATQSSATKLSQLEGKVAGLETDLRARDTQVTELSLKAPDVAALQQQHKAAIDTLKAQHKQELDTRDATLVAERKSIARSEVRRALEALNVDSEYAEMLVNKPEFDKQLRPNDDGAIEIIRADKDSPYAAANGKTVAQLAAADILPKVPKKFVGTQTDSGSALTGNQGGGGNGGAGGAKDKYAAARQAGEAQGKRADNQVSAKDRLSGNSGARK